jgi:hypothetical protein
MKFTIWNKHTNVFTMTAPHRFLLHK